MHKALPRKRYGCGGLGLGDPGTRIVSLVLAVASTIILGLQQLNFWTGLAFSFVAVGTLVSAVEPFFNWRSRWILMEEAQYKPNITSVIRVLCMKCASRHRNSQAGSVRHAR
jgi:hypothetical protein